MSLVQVAYYVRHACARNFRDGWAVAPAALLTLADYFLAAALLAFSLRRRELYPALLSALVFAGGALNYALKATLLWPVPGPDACGTSAFWCTSRAAGAVPCTFRDASLYDAVLGGGERAAPPPHARYGDCVPCGGPSASVQTWATLVVALLVYARQFAPAPHVRREHVCGGAAWLAAVAGVSVFFGLASPLQCVAGAAVGGALGLLVQSALYVACARGFTDAALRRWRALGWIAGGTCYENTLLVLDGGGRDAATAASTRK